jgi:hypothetical protein
MKKWKLTEKQEDFLADTVMDTAKNVMSLLVFGQLLQPALRLMELVFGIVFYLWALHFALRLKKGGEKK